MHRSINDLCEKNGLKYDDYFKLLQLADYSNLKHALHHVIKVVSREEGDKELLAKKIEAMGASAEISQVVATCIWVRREEIHTQLVKDSCNITQSKLEDFDWKLKVNCGTCIVLQCNWREGLQPFQCILYRFSCAADHVQ